MPGMEKFDVLVRGDGCVGRSLALALGAQGLRVALLGAPRRADGADVRTYALNAASQRLLQGLRVWDTLPADAICPIHDMRVMGDQDGAALAFSAWQQGVEALGCIVDAAALEDQLEAALRFSPHVRRVDAVVPAALQAICEGRESPSAAALGAQTLRHDYGQWGLAARLSSDRPHQGQAWQWFRSPDVLALLPFERPQPGHSYGLVWSLPESRARELLAAGPAEFESTLMAATGGAAGVLRLASERQCWPLQLVRSDPLCGPGWVLLGDAAHRVHPLAGQGLNLGLADVASLARVIAAREPWRPLGDERLLRRHVRERAADTWAMGELTDALLRGFAHPHPLVARLRNEGLKLVNQAGPLKKWLTARALGQ
jgi:2-polyprenyl-6-methoxyphenol hydroxylase-like FAD-dependent oxidoreductase